MVLTYFNETCTYGKDYILNHYRMKRFEDKFLITTDCGSWVALDKKEYDSMIRHELDDSLFKILEEKCIILTESNIKHLMMYHRNRLYFLFVGTVLHIIVPTLRCNQKCIYCHSSAANSCDTSKDMDFDTAKKTLEFIFQTPAKGLTIEFQGGDSLMNFELFKHIVTAAKEINKKHRKKLRFALVTNLTLMTEEYLDWITKENVDICTSLDGPKELHDKNRKYETGAGTYDDVTKWLKKLKEKGNGLSALMVTTRYSMKYAKEIIDEYVKWGISHIQIKYINKLGFADKTWKEIGYTIDEFIDFWKECLDYMIELNKKGIKVKERYAFFILNKMFTVKDPAFLDFRSPCGIVIGQLAYNYNGDIYCCDEGRCDEMFRLGNVKTSKYNEVLTQGQSQTLVSSSINDVLACDNCAYKPFCGTCPIMNHAEDGNIIPKLAVSSKCKMLKAQFDYIIEKLLFDKEAREIFFKWNDNWKSDTDKKKILKKNGLRRH